MIVNSADQRWSTCVTHTCILYVPQGPPSWTLQLHTCVPKQPSPPSTHPTQSTVDGEIAIITPSCDNTTNKSVNVPVAPVLGNLTRPSPESERKGLTPGVSVESVQATKDKVHIIDFLALFPGLPTKPVFTVSNHK